MWKLKLSETKEHAERLKFLAGAIEEFNAYEVDTDSAITDRLASIKEPLEAWSDWFESKGPEGICAVILNRTAKRGSLLETAFEQIGYKVGRAPRLYFMIGAKELYKLNEKELLDDIASGACEMTGSVFAVSEVFDELYAALLNDDDAVELVRFDDLTDEEPNRVLAVCPAKVWLKVKDGEELSDLLTNTLLIEQTNRLNAVAENQTALDV